jgi:hypothetical protein
LWRVPIAGGKEVQLLKLGPDAQFTLGKRGIYFLESMYATTLKMMNYETRSVKVIGTLPGPMNHGISVSPDEHWLVYAKSDSAGSQLRLVEKFR